MIAVSPTRNLTFDQRVLSSGRTHKANILLWDFKDLIHPQLMLARRTMCKPSSSTPRHENMVAAGLMNGQVALWNTEKALGDLMRREKRSSITRNKAAGGGDAGEQHGDDDDDVDENAGDKILTIEPLALSHIDERSHKRMVTELVWLAPDAQVNFKCQLLAPEHLDGKSHQFLTISGDGLCLIWDTRYKEIIAGELPHVAKPPRGAKDDKKGFVPTWSAAGATLDAPQAPRRCRRARALPARVRFRRREQVTRRRRPPRAFADVHGGRRNRVRGPTGFARRAAGRREGGGPGEDDADANDATPDYVQWMAADHARLHAGRLASFAVRPRASSPRSATGSFSSGA